MNISKPTTLRQEVLLLVIGKALAHDLASPLMAFQSHCRSVIRLSGVTTRQKKHLNSKRRQFEKEANRILTDVREIAQIMRNPDNRKKLMNTNVVSRNFIISDERETSCVELLNELVDEMNDMISALQSSVNLAEPSTKTLRRGPTTIERIVEALDTILDPEGAEGIREKSGVNLVTMYQDIVTKQIPYGIKVKVSQGQNIRLNGSQSVRRTADLLRGQILLTMQNIVMNAVRFADFHGEGVVTYRMHNLSFPDLRSSFPELFEKYQAHGNWLVLHILNEGERIKPEDSHRIFSLAQGASKKQHKILEHGSGVGLTIAKTMAMNNGGLVFHNQTSILKDHTDFVIALPEKPEWGIDINELFSGEYSALID